MTAPLQSEFKPVDPIVFALNWFKPLGAANAIGAKRWATDLPKPYRWPSIVSASRVGFVQTVTLRMHTLAGTYTDAAREANRTDNRAQVLVDYPGWVPNLLWFEIVDAAHEEPYAAETVATRFVSEYRAAFSLIPS
ncbi:hypothetical protein [Mycolicibacterium gilvum]|uniref:hypothetical protein n=1 Tax=Mycolicibacterium gilvum TaxID=1804 RepID=UPI004045E64C